MNTVPAEHARTHFRHLLDQAMAGYPAVVTRHGEPVAVIVPASFLNIGTDIPADANQTQPV